MTDQKVDVGKIKVKDISEALREPEVMTAFVDRYGAKIDAFIQSAVPVVQSFQKACEKLIPRVTEFLVQMAQVDWEKVREMHGQLPEQTKRVMEAAAKKGWFVGWYSGVSEAFELARLNEDQIDLYMANYYREKMRSLSRDLVDEYPTRALAIGAASRAHLRGSEDDYTLAVPVFIAQGDGILAEILGIRMPLGIYKQRKGEQLPRQTNTTQKVLEQSEREENLKLLAPLLILHTLDFLSSDSKAATIEDAEKVMLSLNRHKVLHGVVSDYGTEINSLKAFSFLCFVGLHVPNYLAPEPSEQNEESPA